MKIRKYSFIWYIKYKKAEIIGYVVMFAIVAYLILSCFQVALQTDNGVPVWNFWKLVTIMGNR